MGHSDSHANAGGQLAVAFAENSRAELRLCGGDGQVSSQLTTGGGKPGQGQPVIAFDAQSGGKTALAAGDVVGTLHGGGERGGRASVATRWAVRRLSL